MTGGRRYRVPTSARALICLALAILLAMAALVGWLAPLDPSGFELGRAWEGPSLGHPCGRDGLGRDVLARLLVGTGTSLGIALTALGCALVAGMGAGCLAGWCGGRIDATIMRGVDLLMGIRELALAVVIGVAIGPGAAAIILILILGWSPPLVRFVRSLVVVQRGRTHVLAATALGASPCRIVATHILPNIAGSMVVRGAALVGPMVQTEAALSFLGIGVGDPAPSLGTLVRDGLSGLRGGPHLITAATLTIFLIALTFTLLADELRHALDPHKETGGPNRGLGPQGPSGVKG